MNTEIIQNKIYEVRGQRVMLDYDIALLYSVETRILNQAVKRNINKFPEDFMFQLTNEEWNLLTFSKPSTSNSSQFVMSVSKNRGKKYSPFAFTEHGVTMVASILKSKKAIEMNIAIVRAFISIRHYLYTQNNLTEKLNEIRQELKIKIDEHDTQLSSIYDALENLLDKKQDEELTKEKWNKRQRIGFKK